MPDVTQILSAIERGEPAASAMLLPQNRLQLHCGARKRRPPEHGDNQDLEKPLLERLAAGRIMQYQAR
jgi:hypothetical protein